MTEASDGFMRPLIDQSKCVDCGLCQKVCPPLSPLMLHRPLRAYIAWTTREKERQNSSSGGVFSEISIWVLNHGGVVYGAAYDEQMTVRHQCVVKAEDLTKLQGSKYVQSRMDDVFKEIKDYLRQGRLVYFAGTPCQVAGLKSYLRKEYDSLITSDLICHGCPSGRLFQSQIKELEKRFRGRIVDFKFRSKKRFGQGYDLQITTEDGKSHFLNVDLLPYFYGFWRNITLRECCYSCKYARFERTGDITLADYWDVKKYHHVRTSKGVSMVLANTEKGLHILEKCKNEGGYLHLEEDDLNRALKVQGHLSHPVEMPKRHIDFFNDNINGSSWEVVKNKYLAPPRLYKYKMHIRNIIKTLILYKLWK